MHLLYLSLEVMGICYKASGIFALLKAVQVFGYEVKHLAVTRGIPTHPPSPTARKKKG